MTRPASDEVRAETDPDRFPTDCDYLVIGGGSGGSAVAGRLAAESDARVVLVESGGSNQRTDVIDPAKWPELAAGNAQWAYRTVPQSGTNDRVHVWSMGKVLGGSSSVNGMMYMRGAPWDYDGWAAAGNAGWDSETVYGAFREIESYGEADSAVRGTGGPVRVERIEPGHPVSAAFLEACEECGYRRSPDFNGLDPEGYGLHQLNVAEGRRQDSATAFLAAAGTKNLIVLLETSAVKLVFDTRSGRVTEVLLRAGDGQTSRLAVQQEVIVCAGAIGSPQLLMLSGIGPQSELRRLGIDPVLDLPGVGENLHDHVGVPVVFEASRPLPASHYQLVEAGLYCRTSPERSHYDAQIPLQLFPYVRPGFESYDFVNGFTMYPGILKPRGRGRVALRTSDPSDQPMIDPAYLTAEEDLTMLIGVMEVARRLGASPAFDEWRTAEAVPGAEAESRERAAAYVRSAAGTYFHPVGTCKMGPGPECVVDSELIVHGTENLRVADAAIMPEIPSGNTNVPTMMIGWRAAQFILRRTAAAERTAVYAERDTA